MAQTISGDAFDLDYMHFDVEKYEELLMQKVESVLALFREEPSFQLCTNRDGSRMDNVTIISSPNVHCRERLRFAMQLRSKIMASDIFTFTDFSEASSAEENLPRDLVYAMWYQGFPTVMVEVCLLLFFLPSVCDSCFLRTFLSLHALSTH